MKDFNYFLDSNIFLRPIIKDSPKRVKECEDLFSKVKQKKLKIFTSTIVLAEIVWVLKSKCRLDRQIISQVISKILAIPNLKIIDNFDIFLSLQFYQQNSVKFIDATIASLIKMQKQEMIIISYDADFDKLNVVRKEPSDLI